MPRLPLLVLTVLALGGLASPTQAEPIRFARSPAVSPDGQHVVFSYLGDLWVVGAAGGSARHLTMHEKHDYNPVFSPDGKRIAFSSNRHGGYDVFVIPLEGGRPTRLTHDSADDHPTGWSPDGKYVLFMSARQTDFPPRVELYRVLATGGMAERITAHEGRDGAYSPKGDQIAYVRGPGTWYRKGYRGSSNDDLWLSDAEGNNNRQLTAHNGQDGHPMWAPDGRTLYYVSDVLGGTANIVRQEINAGPGPLKSPPRLVTHHKDEQVRRAHISANGEWIVYECGPDIWIHAVKDGRERKLTIDVRADDKTNPDRVTNFTAGATEFALSRDEKHLTFVVQGELFLIPRTGGKATRLTDHPAFDHGVAWAPDSKKLLFLSDRGGHEDIYLLEPDDTERPELVKAHRFKVKQLTRTPEAEAGVSFSPDGSKVAFLRAGRLMVMKPDGSGEKVLHQDGQIFDYEWSPDGKWICYARSDSSFASELFIIPATGPTAKDPPRNVTRFATYNGGVTWSKTGNKLAFISQRRRETSSAYVLSLQRPAAAGTSAGTDFDWDDVHLRVKQPASMTISEVAISNDGSKVAFRATQNGSEDLWVANADGGQVTRLTTGGVKPRQITWSRLFSSQLYYRDGNGTIRTVMVTAPAGTNSAAVPFVARMTVRRDDQFAEMFEQSWRAVHETFYDPAFHGADWLKVRDRYRPLVRHCALKEDLYALVSLMLGELNASHLGINGTLGSPDQQTADLGLIFDRSHRGPGLKVLEIVKNGPADVRGTPIKPGDLLLAIDEQDIGPRTDLSELLNDKVNETVTLSLLSNPLDPRSRRRITMRGASRKTIKPLMYERWIKRNAQRVSELSGGKLAYIHIPSMDESGLDRFLRALFSDAFDKQGVVLDVRYNGGGYTHEQVLNYLGGKEHTLFFQRDGAVGFVLNSRDRRYSRPLVLLVNNRSYSDAEIFPHAFRALGLGKLVGQPTGGHVIGTRNIHLIDGSIFRTPRIGVRTNKGVNMEKQGVEPDVRVDVHPDQLARGEDPQLDRAVEVLRQDVEAWLKTRPPQVAGPGAARPPGSNVNPTSPNRGPSPMPRREGD